MQIGGRLRAARRSNRLTLAQLADKTGLTKGFLSKLERDHVAASVASLVRICDALEISLTSLFEPLADALIRKAQARVGNLGGVGIRDTLHTPSTQQHLQVVRSEIEPGGGSGDDPYTLPGDAIFVYILEGRLEITISGRVSHLDEGDAITYSPAERHTWRNPSEHTPTVALWVVTPVP